MNDFSSTRRKFLATAASAASIPLLWNPARLHAAPLVADPEFQFALPTGFRPVRVGMIGVGGRGTALLNEILKSKRAEVVGICDIDPEAIKRATARCEGMNPKGHASYHDLLSRTDVEAVVIATPVDLHCVMAVDTCAANKHVYCEKPMGLSAKEADRIQNAAKKSDKVFQVGFQWVYNANFRSAIEAVHDGVIGDVKFIHAQRHGGDLPHKKSWLFEAKRSGDIIVEQAVHEMNIFCWGLKSHPEKANGLGGNNFYVNVPEGRTIMDNYSLSMEFPGPCTLSYSHLYYAQDPISKTHIWFYGTKGAVDVMEGMIYMADKSVPAPRTMKLTKEDTYNAIVAFFEKVRSGGQADAGIEKGVIATKTSVLGRTAIYNQKTVKWNQIA